MSRSLSGVQIALEENPPFHSLQRLAEERCAEVLIGAPEGLWAPIIAEILTGNSNLHGPSGDVERPVVVAVTATHREAEDLHDALAAFIPGENTALFPHWETLPHERLSPRSDTVGQRLAALRRLKKDPSLQVLITPVRSLLQPLVAGLAELQPVELSLGQSIPFDDVVSRLTAAAYSRVDMVTRRGEYAVRGGIIDIFPAVEDHPVRIEFFGDDIEAIRYFAIADQRTLTGLPAPEQIIADPCRELLITPAVQSRAAKLKASMPAVADMLEKIAGGIAVEGMESLIPVLVDQLVPLTSELPAHSTVLVMEPERVRIRAHDLVASNQEFLEASWAAASDNGVAPVDISSADVSSGGAGALASGNFATIAQSKETALTQGLGWWSISSLGVDAELEADVTGAIDTVELPARAPSGYQGNVSQVLEILRLRATEGWRIILATEGPGPAQRLHELLLESGIPSQRVAAVEAEARGQIQVVTASARRGFVLEPQQLALLTETDLLGRAAASTREMRKMPTKRRGRAIDPLALVAGDYVVHEQHGIGQFVELVQRKIAGGTGTREYLVLEYAPAKRGGPRDRLFVPTEQLDQVSAYVGGDAPALSKMGGSDWAATKSKARRAVKDIAAQLIRLYSARMARPGHAFAPDTPWQRELEEAFPYVETPDQLTTINEVKADMERAIPMDRLVSGDVGYGKTEIAVRAAFKAVQDGKQVAVLVPTTLLAQQHYETFNERYANFPVTVHSLSRFQTASQAKEIKELAASGAADVVIGTHRILSKDFQFKDLGLVIVDEEQRFGVEHKEQLKALRTDVDVLAMSATPIPRTLEMSLTGIRETSTLATPPEERHPVLTYVGPYTDKQVGAAIRRELLREGQVFFVHNRVSTIERVAAQVQALVPEARVAVAHGQMSESRLEQIMVDFWHQRFDVLVCTTIIETGLDISTANTLIVDGADKYGLSQLHQLRGRVGRGRERAYAYFLYPAEKPLGEVALERLKAVAAHNELGSGMQLAMKDLEIRGAGNLLGGEQSGHIAGVGFDLYLRLVGEAVADFRGEEDHTPVEVKLELPVNAHLPHDYVPAERLRLEAYRKLAMADDDEAVAAVREELTDRYGELPEPVENLLAVARLRGLVRNLGLTEVSGQGNFVRFGPVVTESAETPEEGARRGVTLPESRALRLKRLYPGAVVKTDHILVPKPKTAAIGGRDVIDGEVLAWATNLLDTVFASA